MKVQAVLFAISREAGVELVQVHDKSINKQKFKQFLDELRAKNPFLDMMLIMDNLKLHKSKDTKERMDELGFLYTYTPIYSPQYNGIEEVIGIGKRAVKKRRLQLILENKQENLRNVIMEEFSNICPYQTAKCMARSLDLLDLN